MKIVEAVNLFLALQNLAEMKMPVRVSYAVAKNIRHLEADYKFFEDSKKRMQGDYFTKDAEGTQVVVEGKQAELDQAWKELMELQVDAEIHKVSLSAFGDVALTPAQLYALDEMIES